MPHLSSGSTPGYPWEVTESDSLPTAVADEVDGSALVVHDPVTPEAEPRPGSLTADPVTPARRLFIRNNLVPPAVRDGDRWTVAVEGVVAPRTFTVAELATGFPATTMPAVLQCAGNGRRFLDEPAGTPWATGAAGGVEGTGVRLADVVAACGGPRPGLAFLTATGGDPTDNPAERVERSIPAAKALADCLLAVQMNGEPLGLAHGAPVRFVVPGYYAVNSVKYVVRLAFTAAESDAAIMATRYRVTSPGETSSPDDESCWAMNVKSWVVEPGAGQRLPPGPVHVEGVAFAGERTVAGVEVSGDAGRTWTPARLDADRGPAAWRRFTARLDLAAGRHVLVSRATDEAGDRQPERSEPNVDGYRNNGWAEPAVSVDVVDPADPGS